MAEISLAQFLDGTDLRDPRSLSNEPQLYGGAILGRMVAAASAGKGAQCASLQANFLRYARIDRPLRLDCTMIADRRNADVVTVTAVQDDSIVATGIAAFHAARAGPDLSDAIPPVTPPDGLPDLRDERRVSAARHGRPPQLYLADRFVDFRIAEQRIDGAGRGGCAVLGAWFRTRDGLGDLPALHQSAIAFASDTGMTHLGAQAHNRAQPGVLLKLVSLDHTIWFHRATRADDWLLQIGQCPTIADGRGIALAAIYDRSGDRVATLAQQFVARYVDGARAGS